MPQSLNHSAVLSSIPTLQYGFVSNHTEGGREAHDRAEAVTATVKQVHRDQLVWATGLEKKEREADAIATIEPGLAVGVYSADCTPVLVAALDVKNQPIGVMAIHAGWRGTALGIVGKAFGDFHGRLAGQGPLRYVAVIGPCISFESFEVGAEVVEAFPGSLELGLAKFLREEGGQQKFLFDLPGENARQLRDAAARESVELELELSARCTLLEKDAFPSYRRDNKNAGRLLSYIGFQR
jgi:YfiH family protein